MVELYIFMDFNLATQKFLDLVHVTNGINSVEGISVTCEFAVGLKYIQDMRENRLW